MTAPAILTSSQVADALERWPRWTGSRDRFVLTTEFAGFDEAVAFMNEVFAIAKAQDHHPELSNVYNRVTLEMTTHDAGGVSDRDLQFIAAVEAL